MKIATWYHGTDDTSREAILRDGFDLNADRRHDCGDFGWGVYLGGSLPRARSYGGNVVQVELDESRFARIVNPYFVEGFCEVKPVTDVEKLFHSLAFVPGQYGGNQVMLTVRGTREARYAASKRVATAFLEAGYAGIISEHSGGETVVFDTTAIASIRPTQSSGSPQRPQPS